MNDQPVTVIPTSVAPVAVRSGPHFGKILLAARVCAGLRPGPLARRIGCTPSLIGMRERHDRRLTVDDAIRVLDALGYKLVVMPRALAPTDDPAPGA